MKKRFGYANKNWRKKLEKKLSYNKKQKLIPGILN